MPENITIQLITTGGVILVAILQMMQARRSKNIERDVGVTRYHTENSHANAEYPNMRDELTATRHSVNRGFDIIEGYIKDVDRDQKATRHSLERHLEAVDSLLADVENKVNGEVIKMIHDSTHITYPVATCQYCKEATDSSSV